MFGLIASISGLVQARAKSFAARLRVRAILVGTAAVMVLLAIVFALMAAAVALGQEIGLVPALLVMSLTCIVILGIILGLMAREKRKARELTLQRKRLDTELYRSALAAAAPIAIAKGPKALLALGAVAIAALLVKKGLDSRQD